MYGSYSTQVSRSLHTSVHRAPHKCGLNSDYQWGLRRERGKIKEKRAKMKDERARRKEKRGKGKVERRYRHSCPVIVGKVLKCMDLSRVCPKG